jgi:hypothetical protein
MNRKKWIASLSTLSVLILIAGSVTLLKTQKEDSLTEESPSLVDAQAPGLKELDKKADPDVTTVSHASDGVSPPRIPPTPALPSGTEVAQLAPTPKAEQVAEPEPTCFTLQYDLKNPRTQEFSQKKNLLTLDHENINAPSLCVRIDGIPVAHQAIPGKSNQILVDAIGHRSAKVTASYCTGKESCPVGCEIPRDEFFESLGTGISPEEKLDQYGQLDKEVQELRGLIQDFHAQRLNSNHVFQGWNSKKIGDGCSIQKSVALN